MVNIKRESAKNIKKTIYSHRCYKKSTCCKNNKISFFDVTKEKDLFCRIVQYSGDEITLIDKKGIIVFVNQSAIKALGYSYKYVVGQLCTRFFQSKISINSWKKTYFEQIKKKDKPVSFILQRKIKGSKVQTIDTTAVYLKYNAEEYILMVSRNITNQIILQNKLIESQERYQVLTEQSVLGVVTIDLNGDIIYANNAAEKLVGIPLRESKGTNFIRYVNKGSIKKAMELFSRVSRGHSSLNEEIQIIDRKGNPILVDIAVSPILRNKKIFQINIIMKDISNRKRVEQLEINVDKQKALHEIIYGTTQEIQNPLMGLYQSTEKMLSKYKNRYFEYIGYKEFQEIMDTLEVMKNQIKYCCDTTGRLLELNKKKVGLKDNNANVNLAVKSTIKKAQHIIDVSDIKIKLKLNDKLPRVNMRELELNQVLISVITNALQAVQLGGGILLKTKYIKSKNIVEINCKDDGIGIPKDVLVRVFDPFFTTKHRGLEKNSGLGLSIANSLVKSAKGNISISSVFRKGTVVNITLPVYTKSKNNNKI